MGVLKKRKIKTPKARVEHNKREKTRMGVLRAAFDDLKAVLPKNERVKISKVKILILAMNYIISLSNAVIKLEATQKASKG